MGFTEVRQPLAPGVVITLCEQSRQVQVPELSIKQRRSDEGKALIRNLSEMRSRLLTMSRDPDATFEAVSDLAEEVVDVGVKIVCLALKRNYPEVTEEDLGDFAPTQMREAVEFALNGTRTAKPGENLAPVATIANGAPATS